MSHVIEVDFKQQLSPSISIVDDNAKSHATIMSQADLMLETLTLYNIHFWANESLSNKKLTHKQCREFGIKLRDLRIKINSLVHDHVAQNKNTLCEKFLQYIQKEEFKEILDYFDDLDIPFIADNVIEIEQFIKNKSN